MSSMSTQRRKLAAYWPTKHRRIIQGRKRKQEKLLSLGEKITDFQKAALQRISGFFGKVQRANSRRRAA